ncbi:unnamed protein product, partial [Gongylonema pulchrum]|uniref:Ig-like domain-containing protein n=1 Tax=Gongylonema pulchrum TaxID=637853 RepID=A0A183DWV9_9BILA
MIPAYLVYRHYQNKRKMRTDVPMESLNDITSIQSLLTPDRETFALQGVAAKRITECNDESEDCYINGKLSLIEKPYGVMIEWVPLEEDGWVLATEDDSENLSRSTDSADSRRDYINKLKFSVDIRDLRSFQCVEPNK